jgi:hypothetical protein
MNFPGDYSVPLDAVSKLFRSEKHNTPNCPFRLLFSLSDEMEIFFTEELRFRKKTKL